MKKIVFVPDVLDGQICSTAFCVLRPNRIAINPRFLYWIARSEAVLDQVLLKMRGVSYPAVSDSEVTAASIPVPPIAEQTRIVEAIEVLLSDLDAATEILRQAATRLKPYRQAVLKAAVEGELSREWREAHQGEIEPASELLKRILAERRRRWEESELAKMRAKGIEPKGEKWKEWYVEPLLPSLPNGAAVPSNWTWTTVDQLSLEPLCNGVSIKASADGTGTRALRLTAMSDSGLNYDEVRFLPIPMSDVSDIIIRAGDFFVSRGNGSLKFVGRGSMAQEPPFPTIFPDTMIRVRLHSSQCETRWVPSIWSGRLVRRQIEERVKTTAGIWKISQPQLASVTVPLPPLEEQKIIAAELARLSSIAESTETAVQIALHRAARLRQAILEKAFRGELVPQDPNDEPASILLERIRAQRAAEAVVVKTTRSRRVSPRGQEQ